MKIDYDSALVGIIMDCMNLVLVRSMRGGGLDLFTRSDVMNVIEYYSRRAQGVQGERLRDRLDRMMEEEEVVRHDK